MRAALAAHPWLTRTKLREILHQVLISDVDLRHLCIDSDGLREALSYLVQQMEFESQINVLLERFEPSEIYNALVNIKAFRERLQRYFPELPTLLPKSEAPAGTAHAPASGPREPGSAHPVVASHSRPTPGPESAYSADWYVEREAEEKESLSALAFPGSAVVFEGPSRYGKTWLLRRLIEQLESKGRVVNLNLLSFADRETLTEFGPFARAFASQVLERACDVEPTQAAALITQQWQHSPDSTSNLTRWMAENVLPSFAADRWLILAIDGIDRLRPYRHFQDLLRMLRGWMEDSAVSQPWRSLRLLLTLSTAPHLMVHSINQSVFYSAKCIELPDLEPEQVLRLFDMYQLPATEGDLTALMALVGGHPYLVRQALHYAALHHLGLAAVLDARCPVFERFLSDCDQRLRNEPDLYGAFHRVIGNPRAEVPFPVFDRLRRGGFLAQDPDSFDYGLRWPLLSRLARRG